MIYLSVFAVCIYVCRCLVCMCVCVHVRVCVHACVCVSACGMCVILCVDVCVMMRIENWPDIRLPIKPFIGLPISNNSDQI